MFQFELSKLNELLSIVKLPSGIVVKLILTVLLGTSVKTTVNVSPEPPSFRLSGVPLTVNPGSTRSRVAGVENVEHTYSSLLMETLNELLSKDIGGAVKTRF